MLKTLAAELLARRWEILPLASPASTAESILESASVMVVERRECAAGGGDGLSCEAERSVC
jgi:hypothetical protein